MLIENDILIVKSWPENWNVENSGKKANTIRQVSDYEWDKFDLAVEGGILYTGSREITRIRVINTDTSDYFDRNLTDVTLWYTAGNHILILSWNPAEGNETET